ncbi:MAG: tRNA 2-thiouridine(34) synthase MnmA [Candidatus Pacearchaeota archaeon]
MRKKILLAMSGGVDSSVAALILKRKGFEVIGVFLKMWSNEDELNNCNWIEDRKTAFKIAAKIEIPLLTYDFESLYKEEVIKEMFENYRKGITPNPDIDCNKKIKFPLLLKLSKKLKCDYISTGHYIRIKKDKQKKLIHVYRALDEKKDQSYFLYKLDQKTLTKCLFPIGDLKKEEVRKIAKKQGFENYNKKGTVGICFIGKINFKKFLETKIKNKRGEIKDPEGKTIGYHDGVFYYTIGQRLGGRLGDVFIKKEKGIMKRWYVARKDIEKNEIIAAPDGHPLLFKKFIKLKEVHWISEKPNLNDNFHVRIRQQGELLNAKIVKNKEDFIIELEEPAFGVSPGQSAVIYEKKTKKVFGGGIILS